MVAVRRIAAAMVFSAAAGDAADSGVASGGSLVGVRNLGIDAGGGATARGGASTTAATVVVEATCGARGVVGTRSTAPSSGLDAPSEAGASGASGWEPLGLSRATTS